MKHVRINIYDYIRYVYIICISYIHIILYTYMYISYTHCILYGCIYTLYTYYICILYIHIYYVCIYMYIYTVMPGWRQVACGQTMMAWGVSAQVLLCWGLQAIIWYSEASKIIASGAGKVAMSCRGWAWDLKLARHVPIPLSIFLHGALAFLCFVCTKPHSGPFSPIFCW